MLLLDNFNMSYIESDNELTFKKIEFDEVIKTLTEAKAYDCNIVDCVNDLTLDEYLRKLFVDHNIELDNNIFQNRYIKFSLEIDMSLYDMEYVAVIAHRPSPDNPTDIEWWLVTTT